MCSLQFHANATQKGKKQTDQCGYTMDRGTLTIMFLVITFQMHYCTQLQIAAIVHQFHTYPDHDTVQQFVHTTHPFHLSDFDLGVLVEVSSLAHQQCNKHCKV